MHYCCMQLCDFPRSGARAASASFHSAGETNGSTNSVAWWSAHGVAPRPTCMTCSPWLLQVQQPRRAISLITRASTMSVNDFKTGVTIEIDGSPFRVLGKDLRLPEPLSSAFHKPALAAAEQQSSST